MHVDYDTEPWDTNETCEVLECLCEGFVRAHIVEIGRDPDAYPCCVKCGEFVCEVSGDFYPHPTGMTTKAVRQRPGRTFFGNPQRHTDDPGAFVSTHEAPSKVQVRSPSDLAEGQRGSAVDLAVFQCAQERRRDKQCSVRIWRDAYDRMHAVVIYPDGTIKDPRDDAVSPPGCGCGVPGG